jgi:hypothetical protein
MKNLSNHDFTQEYTESSHCDNILEKNETISSMMLYHSEIDRHNPPQKRYALLMDMHPQNHANHQ